LNWISLAAWSNRTADTCHGADKPSAAVNSSFVPLDMTFPDPRTAAMSATQPGAVKRLPHQSA
jgi:hypothetical protein